VQTEIERIKRISKEFIDGIHSVMQTIKGLNEILPDELKSTKLYTWDNSSAKVNVYDTITKVKESFNVNI